MGSAQKAYTLSIQIRVYMNTNVLIKKKIK